MISGTSLMVQRLRLRTYTAGDAGLIPGWGASSHVPQGAAKNKRKREKITSKPNYMPASCFMLPNSLLPPEASEAYAFCSISQNKKTNVWEPLLHNKGLSQN